MSFQLSKLLVLQGLARGGRESTDCRWPTTALWLQTSWPRPVKTAYFELAAVPAYLTSGKDLPDAAGCSTHKKNPIVIWALHRTAAFAKPSVAELQACLVCF